ncbi:SH3 domain-containing protein [Leptospira harrisiae]|uniref:SH3 domain-containing protein n=1 Tax=Leptospira harrisiae TaxID=2023189 RepID=UPI000C2A8F6E|nr:SH3 domain-containing protein [Leptospira harrisiae]PKA06402.1 hypothetical protein CH366_19310 [Leptospira harrisiae]
MKYSILSKFLIIFFVILLKGCNDNNKEIDQNYIEVNNKPHFRISGKNVRLRKKPSINSEIIKTLTKNQIITIPQNQVVFKEKIKSQDKFIDGYWIYLKVDENLTGYVFSYYIGMDFPTNNRPGIIIAPIENEKFEIIGLSMDGLIENPSKYFNPDYIKIDGLPNYKFALIDFSGNKTNILESIQLYNKDYNCEELTQCIIGKIKNQSKKKIEFGINDSENLAYIPNNPLNLNLKTQLYKLVIFDSKKKVYDDKSINQDSLDNESNWKFTTVSFKNSKNVYLISELNSSKIRLSNSDYHIYRIDIIKNNKPTNIYFRISKGPNVDIEETISVTDLNNDSFPEIWQKISGYEWYYYSIVILIGEIPIRVYSGGGSGS